MAILAFPYLEKELHPGKKITNIIIVFIVWAIAVPVIALIFTVLGKIWSYIEQILPFITTLTSSIYEKYDNHPILVISIVILGILSFFVWKRWWHKVLANTIVRILCITVSVIFLIFISSPIADLVQPEKESNTPTEKNKVTQPQQSLEDSIPREVAYPIENIQYKFMERNAELVRSIELGDSAIMSRIYTINAKIIQSNTKSIEGILEIESYWQSVINKGVKKIRFEIFEAQASGDLAYEIGTYKLYSLQEQLFEDGKYINIWLKENSTWKLHRIIWDKNKGPESN